MFVNVQHTITALIVASGSVSFEPASLQGRRGIVNQQKLAMRVLYGQAGRQQFNNFLEESEFGLSRAGISTVVHRSHESCCFSAICNGRDLAQFPLRFG